MDSETLTKCHKVPPIRNLLIPAHQTSVDIGLFMQRTAGLDPDLLAEVQHSVHNCRGNSSEAEPIRHCERRRKEERTVFPVLLDVECRGVRKNSRDIIGFAGVIEGST